MTSNVDSTLIHPSSSFDCKVRRESTNLQDLFIAHIGAMDCFALALRKMARLVQEKKFDGLEALLQQMKADCAEAARRLTDVPAIPGKLGALQAAGMI